MFLVEKNYSGYDFYYSPACGDRNALYNIVITGSPAPTGGYYNIEYIEKIKKVEFPIRYKRRQYKC